MIVTHTHTHTHIYIYTYTHTTSCKRMHSQPLIDVHIRKLVQMYTYATIYICGHTQPPIYIQTSYKCTQTQLHIYAHTHYVICTYAYRSSYRCTHARTHARTSLYKRTHTKLIRTYAHTSSYIRMRNQSHIYLRTLNLIRTYAHIYVRTHNL